MANVDLVINCYEKTYRKVLRDRFIKDILSQNRFKFENVLIVINNVKNKKEVSGLAEELKKEGVIDGYFFVRDYLDEVLNIVDLKEEELRPIVHYTDWALVCLYIARSEYLVHWDPDVYLERPSDWITPSIKKMQKDRNYVIASPLWGLQAYVIGRESYEECEDFLYNRDFSDQIFLVRKEELLKPIYRYNHIYSLRFPLAHIGSTFEKRIDSYMKKEGKTRLIYKRAIYTHPQDSGSSYPRANILRTVLHYVYMVIIVFYFHLFYFCKHKLGDVKGPKGDGK